jgi:hypothetical protein
MVEKDLCNYRQSLAAELEVTKNRVRNLIGSCALGIGWFAQGDSASPCA